MVARSPFSYRKKRAQRQTSQIPPGHQLSTSWLYLYSFPHLNLTLLAPVADVVDHLGTLRPLLRGIEVVREIRATLKEDTFQFTTLDGGLDGLAIVGKCTVNFRWCGAASESMTFWTGQGPNITWPNILRVTFLMALPALWHPAISRKNTFLYIIES